MNNKIIPTSKISNNGTAKISAPSGKKIYITLISNAHSGATTLTFADDSDLEVFELPVGYVSLSSPIQCSSFTPGNVAVSVAYYTI
jgi:hypothetical protein